MRSTDGASQALRGDTPFNVLLKPPDNPHREGGEVWGRESRLHLRSTAFPYPTRGTPFSLYISQGLDGAPAGSVGRLRTRCADWGPTQGWTVLSSLIIPFPH